MSHFTISPSVGVGPLRLGMSRDDVRRAMGSPDHIQDVAYLEPREAEEWSYLLAGLELDFSRDEDWRLVRITILRNTATLYGEALLGVSEPVLRQFCDLRALRHAVSFEMSNPDLRDIECPDLAVSFWLENGVVQNIAISPLYDATGNTALWPAHEVG